MYRPDLMSVIVVGDIDEKEIEQKIKTHFSALKNSGSLKRADKTLPPFKKGFANLVEKEGGSAFIQVLFSEPYKNVSTDDDVRRVLVRQYISSLLNLGFQKLNQEFWNRNASFGGFALRFSHCQLCSAESVRSRNPLERVSDGQDTFFKVNVLPS